MVGVGAGEATLSPATYSMLADSFPPHKLTTAIALFSLGAYVGNGLACILGGSIVALATASGVMVLPLLREVHPWQVVFVVVGAPGLLLACLPLTFPEPPCPGQGVPRRGREAAWELFSFLGSQRRLFICHHVGFTLALAVVTGLLLR